MINVEPMQVILDLDGTLLHENQALPNAVRVVNQLIDAGHQVGYATNDAVWSVADQRDRLAHEGFPLVDGDGAIPLMTAATITAEYLLERGRSVRRVRVFLLGAPAVATELADAGEIVDEEPDVVVVGLDLSLSYERLANAVAVVDDGVELVATNADVAWRDTDGHRRPGAGAVVAFIETATARQARVLGKPSPALYEAVLSARGGERDESKIVVVGDSGTDLIAGRKIGAFCVGVGPASGHRFANAALQDLGDLPNLLEHALVSNSSKEEAV